MWRSTPAGADGQASICSNLDLRAGDGSGGAGVWVVGGGAINGVPQG
jgi:hypothetical protein